MEPDKDFDLLKFLTNYGNFQGGTTEAIENLKRRQDELEKRFGVACEELTKLRVFQGRTSVIIGLVISVVTAAATVLVAKLLGLLVGGG